MSEALISVIVPVYKVEQYLDKCISSIVNQTYKNLEIILVDDGSPDGCPGICDAWAEKDSRIRVIHKANGGLSDARNAGLEIATGEYIAFVDSDDWIELEFCKTLLTEITKYSADVVSCKYERTDGSDNSNKENENIKAECLNGVQAMTELIYERKIQQVVWNKLYKKSIISSLFEVGKYHEDEFWTYQIIGNCNNVLVTDYTGYNYLQRPDSIMGQSFSKKRLDAIEARVKRQDYLRKEYPELYNDALVNLYFEIIYLGQLALKYNSSEAVNAFWDYLNSVIREYPLPSKKVENLKWRHWAWLKLSGLSLKGTCMLRNYLSVGY